MPRGKRKIMADVISEYQKWKQQGENLKAQAKQAMESRFRELLSEAISVAEEYRADFGRPLKPPPPITAFRYKAVGRSKSKKSGKQRAIKLAEAAPPEPKPQKKPDPKLVRLQQRLAAAKKKLDDAKIAGTPTRPLEDRVYEIEDAMRLMGQPS
jgi:hypothetical protein